MHLAYNSPDHNQMYKFGKIKFKYIMIMQPIICKGTLS